MGQHAARLERSEFWFFLWTQFLGAFNDNVYKIVVSMFAIHLSESAGYLPAVGAIFIVPFLFFSGYAGHIADVFNKRNVLIATKGCEIVVMILATAAFGSGRIEWMLGALFLAALQATFFSPAKYGIVPEMIPEAGLSRANGFLEMTTFLAIVLGTALGGLLFSVWKNHLEWIGAVLVIVAVIGTSTSLKITKVPTSGAKKRFNINPWGEVKAGIQRLYPDKNLWLTVISISYFWFLGALLQMEILLFGKEVMHLNDFWISLLGTALAIGIGLGSLAAGRLSGLKVELGFVPLGAIGMGLFLILLSFSDAYLAAASALAFLGFFGGFFIVPLNSFLQQKGGREEKGRLIATNNFMNTLGILLASGVFWILHDNQGIAADRSIFLLGIFTFLVTVYIFKVLPDSSIPLIRSIRTHTIGRMRGLTPGGGG